MPDRKAFLVLADGTAFEGTAFGYEGECSGEVVFNTGMTGYQEVLTDPSYKGQIVTMTYPEIGNTGINPEDVESNRPWVEGFVVREAWARRRTGAMWSPSMPTFGGIASAESRESTPAPSHGVCGTEGPRWRSCRRPTSTRIASRGKRGSFLPSWGATW